MPDVRGIEAMHPNKRTVKRFDKRDRILGRLDECFPNWWKYGKLNAVKGSEGTQRSRVALSLPRVASRVHMVTGPAERHAIG